MSCEVVQYSPHSFPAISAARPRTYCAHTAASKTSSPLAAYPATSPERMSPLPARASAELPRVTRLTLRPSVVSVTQFLRCTTTPYSAANAFALPAGSESIYSSVQPGMRENSLTCGVMTILHFAPFRTSLPYAASAFMPSASIINLPP